MFLQAAQGFIRRRKDHWKHWNSSVNAPGCILPNRRIVDSRPLSSVLTGKLQEDLSTVLGFYLIRSSGSFHERSKDEDANYLHLLANYLYIH